MVTMEQLQEHLSTKSPVVRHFLTPLGYAGSVSVQASTGHYCTPKEDQGPYSEVEGGFPSEVPTEFLAYAEDPYNPTSTVYGYVPVGLVLKYLNRIDAYLPEDI